MYYYVTVKQHSSLYAMQIGVDLLRHASGDENSP